MKVVKVYGALKERLGQSRFELNVETPAQAIRGLCANFEGLQKWIIDSELDGIGYKVFVGKEQVTEDNIDILQLPWSEKEVFSITPVITGAGRGFGRILVGALMIGAAIYFGPAGAGFMQAGMGATTSAGFTIGAAASSFIGSVGAALVLGGVADMLSPLPEMPRDPSRNESYGFGGVANTMAQGTPVPIAYGRLFVGSSPISIGLDVDQVQV